MKQIVILSGKGGTGKTTFTAAFAQLASEKASTRAVLVDADVDAANLELLLAPQVHETHEYYGGQIASISTELCAGCGWCEAVCRFDAIHAVDGYYTVDPIACEGCATCKTQCPQEAISLLPQLSGRWFVSSSRYGPLYHARLTPAQESSGKLVALLREQAIIRAEEEEAPLLIVDGPPGIGCPVIAAVTGTDLIIVVAEPTSAGIHDMQRALDLAAHFGVQALICINKADLYPEGSDQIQAYCQQHQLPVIGQLPFDLTVTEAMVHGQPITTYQPDGPASHALRGIWEAILEYACENRDNQRSALLHPIEDKR
ncbi:MAG: ATP-binding protein [Anaerolineae bacterium]|nr:ATP-binding protein [Anaerolineae bacterium]